MSKFYSLQVKDLYKETQDCTVITLEVPEELHEMFRFRQGQHLTFRKIWGEEEVRRTYSLCTSPDEKVWSVAVKQIPTGVFSTYVNEQLRVGDWMEVMPPGGPFGVATEPTKSKTYAAFAAGSGITPIMSMIKTHLQLEPESRFVLFYLNKTARSIIFKEQIEALKNKFLGRFQVFYFLDVEKRDIDLLTGRFSAEKLQDINRYLLPFSQVDELFICGPEPMIFMLRDALIDLGMKKNHIHFELFISGLSAEARQQAAQAVEQKIEGTHVTIIDGGKDFTFVMGDQYDTILDGALAAGADLPFACKGGVCSTCKCKILEGSVQMKINYALEDYELAQNFVLSCQAVPTSEKVVVDFDI
jgi:ring-1,2-phenylacetyl-CoA epoxidase subunit PaaE